MKKQSASFSFATFALSFILASCNQTTSPQDTAVPSNQLEQLSTKSEVAGEGPNRVQLFFNNGVSSLATNTVVGVRMVLLCDKEEHCVRFGSEASLPIGQLRNGLEVDFADANTTLGSVRELIVVHQQKLSSNNIKFSSQSIKFRPALQLKPDSANTIFLKFEAAKNDDADLQTGLQTLDLSQRLRLSYQPGMTTANQRFFASIGGASNLEAFFANNDAATVAAALDAFGIKFINENPEPGKPGQLTTLASTDCFRNFSAADSGAWHTLSGGTYYVDSVGRPSIARRNIPPVVAAARDATCQAAVGNLESATGYDGGHLIASQIGGYGRRLNLVPQNLNFNRGNWAQIENKLAGCGGLASGSVAVEVKVAYPTTAVVTPNLFTYSVTIGTNMTKSFTNTDLGGANGTADRTALVNFLGTKGCI